MCCVGPASQDAPTVAKMLNELNAAGAAARASDGECPAPSMAAAVRTWKESFLDGIVAEVRPGGYPRIPRGRHGLEMLDAVRAVARRSVALSGSVPPAVLCPQSKERLTQEARKKANAPTLAW